jgi:hypothetical protein
MEEADEKFEARMSRWSLCQCEIHNTRKEFKVQGLIDSQATHWLAFALFFTMQVPHFQPALLGTKPAAAKLNEVGALAGTALPVLPGPGLADSHETHCDASSLLSTMQMEHFQPPATLGANPAAAKLKVAGAAAGGPSAGPNPGFGDSHATHCEASALLPTRHSEHVQPLF